MFKFLIFPFLLIPSATLLTLDTNSKFRELPEYSEYLRKLGLSENRTTTPTMPTTSYSSTIAAEPSNEQQSRIDTFAPLAQFPLVEICRRSPTDLYGHVICWTLLALYLLLIVTLIIYQFRSYFWFKNNHRNGRHYHSENFKLKSKDEPDIQRMFSLRSIA